MHFGDKLDFTFLTKGQCFYGEVETLEKRGTIAPITDFSILLGGCVCDNYYYNNSKSLEDRSGYYWTKSPFGSYEYSSAWVVHYDGDHVHCNVDCRGIGARPILPYTSISNISSNKVKASDGIFETEYGEYPQKIASKELQIKLERAYNYNDFSYKKNRENIYYGFNKCY